MKTTLSLIGAAIALGTAGAALAQSQGVSKDEIVLGSIQDLSGPIAGFGKQVRLGMMLRVDEANEQGGVNGRKLKLIVEDSKYDPRNAVLAAQKLVNQDKIFMMVGHIGTAQNMAANSKAEAAFYQILTGDQKTAYDEARPGRGMMGPGMGGPGMGGPGPGRMGPRGAGRGR